jgi:transcriptional regulator with XRE-family HTH domain
MTSHARGAPTADARRQERRGLVLDEERARLARSFGTVLVAERGAARLTQSKLAELAGLAACTVARLENGRQRPTIGSTWRLARALRPDGSYRTQVALDLRFQHAAGASLRCYSRRPNLRRQRVAAELLAAGPLPVTSADGFEAFTITLMATSS